MKDIPQELELLLDLADTAQFRGKVLLKGVDLKRTPIVTLDGAIQDSEYIRKLYKSESFIAGKIEIRDPNTFAGCYVEYDIVRGSLNISYVDGGNEVKEKICKEQCGDWACAVKEYLLRFKEFDWLFL